MYQKKDWKDTHTSNRVCFWGGNQNQRMKAEKHKKVSSDISKGFSIKIHIHTQTHTPSIF